EFEKEEEGLEKGREFEEGCRGEGAGYATTAPPVAVWGAGAGGGGEEEEEKAKGSETPVE
nr:hypothetical protein [Tanacetum cinerariifolium]